MCFVAALKGGDWIVAAVASAGGVCLLSSLSATKLQIRESGLTYRDLDFRGSHTVEFAQIEKAYFEEYRDESPQALRQIKSQAPVPRGATERLVAMTRKIAG